MRCIAHLSDLHFGRHDDAVAEDLLRDLCRAAPDLVVISGDLTQRARRREFASARAFIDRLPAPVLAVPGNHDLPLYDVAQRLIDPRRLYRRFISAEPEPFFEDAELVVQGLDTTRAGIWKDGRISSAQTARLDRTFALAGERLRILVTHHPLIAASGTPGQVTVRRGLLALRAVERASVDVLLSGHYHLSSSADRPVFPSGPGRTVLVVHAGTGISTRRRDEGNSYNLLAVEGDRLTCAVRVWQQGRFAAGLKLAYRRAAGGWTRIAA